MKKNVLISVLIIALIYQFVQNFDSSSELYDEDYIFTFSIINQAQKSGEYITFAENPWLSKYKYVCLINQYEQITDEMKTTLAEMTSSDIQIKRDRWVSENNWGAAFVDENGMGELFIVSPKFSRFGIGHRDKRCGRLGDFKLWKSDEPHLTEQNINSYGFYINQERN